MRLHITDAIQAPARARLEAMYEAGQFPEVHYEKSEHFKSYYMFEDGKIWATFMKLLDTRMKEQGLDPKLGVFTRKHSAKFLDAVMAIVGNITESDVRAADKRFTTWFD